MKQQELKETRKNKLEDKLWEEKDSISVIQSQTRENGKKFKPYNQQDQDQDDEEEEEQDVPDNEEDEDSGYDEVSEKGEIMKKKNYWDEDDDMDDKKEDPYKGTVTAKIDTYQLQDNLNRIKMKYRVDETYVKLLRIKDKQIQRRVLTNTEDPFYYLRDKFLRLHCQEYYDKFTQEIDRRNEENYNMLMFGDLMTKEQYKQYKQTKDDNGLLHIPASIRDKYLEQEETAFEERRKQWFRQEKGANVPQNKAYHRRNKAEKAKGILINKKQIKVRYKVNRYGFKSDVMTIEELAMRRNPTKGKGEEEDQEQSDAQDDDEEEEEHDSFGDDESIVKKKKKKKKNTELQRFKDQLKDLKKQKKQNSKNKTTAKQLQFINRIIDITKRKIKECKKKKRDKRKAKVSQTQSTLALSKTMEQSQKSRVSYKSQKAKSIALSQGKSTRSKKSSQSKVKAKKKVDEKLEKMISDYKEEVSKKTIEQSYQKFVNKDEINRRVKETLFQDELVNTSNILKDMESNKSFEMELSKIDDKFQSIEDTQKQLEDLVNSSGDEGFPKIKRTIYANKSDDEAESIDMSEDEGGKIDEFEDDDDKEDKEKPKSSEQKGAMELENISTATYQSGMAQKMEQYNVDLGLDEFSDEDDDDDEDY